MSPNRLWLIRKKAELILLKTYLKSLLSDAASGKSKRKAQYSKTVLTPLCHLQRVLEGSN